MSRPLEPEQHKGYSVRIVLPAEPLRRYITAYNLVRVDFAEPISDYLFPEWINMRLTYKGGWDVGSGPDDAVPKSWPVIHASTSRPTFIRSRSASTFAVGLVPGGWSRFWRADASAFVDKMLPLGDLLGPSSLAFEAAIAEADDLDRQAQIADHYFLNLLAETPELPSTALVFKLHELLNHPDTTSVEQVCEEMDMSQARLARLCTRSFGFPPKLLLRRQRFLRMLGALHFRAYEEWRDFLDPHYVDQSHFIRDFQRFIGMSPSQYLALPRLIQQPAVSQRAALMGQPVQGLHG